jgi:hypothetical protein
MSRRLYADITVCPPSVGMRRSLSNVKTRFMGTMAGLSRLNFEVFAEKFDFSKFETLCGPIASG